MELFTQFINEYGTEILNGIVTAVVGWLAIVVKKIYNKVVNDKTKESVVKTVVKAVEQIYKDLHGEEKLNKALEAASEMLLEKGITVSDLELRMLIESAVAEFNDVFYKPVLEEAPEVKIDF